MSGLRNYMGMLINGNWTEDDDSIVKGAFRRTNDQLHRQDLLSLLAKCTNPMGRFVLIGSLSCPWSHRTLIIRSLKGLDEFIPIHIAGGWRDQGYSVNYNKPWKLPGVDEPIFHIHDVYTASDANYTGRASVPVLWDSEKIAVASNDSLTIVKVLDEMEPKREVPNFTIYPETLRTEIDILCSRINESLANGVYRAGLAQNQETYDAAVTDVFNMLDELEIRLRSQRLLIDNVLTLADIVLFPVLARFDAVYHSHFRCSKKRLVDYHTLWAYARDLYSWHGMSEHVDFDIIREGYFLNDGYHNPFGIISAAPQANWNSGHEREKLGSIFVLTRESHSIQVFPNH